MLKRTWDADVRKMAPLLEWPVKRVLSRSNPSRGNTPSYPQVNKLRNSVKI